MHRILNIGLRNDDPCKGEGNSGKITHNELYAVSVRRSGEAIGKRNFSRNFNMHNWYAIRCNPFEFQKQHRTPLQISALYKNVKCRLNGRKRAFIRNELDCSNPPGYQREYIRTFQLF